MATNPIAPAPGLVSFRLWDGWHNPTCILGQITTIGRLTMIDTLRMENADVEMLIKAKINPMLESPKWKGVARGWRDIGDISMRTPDQSNISRSAAKVIEEQLDTHFEGGPKDVGASGGRDETWPEHDDSRYARCLGVPHEQCSQQDVERWLALQD